MPVNPVEQLEVLLSSSQASISWQAPYLGYSEGCAAFTSWKYRVNIQEVLTNNSMIEENIVVTRLRMGATTPMKASTLYQIQVMAYSPAGNGPWSLTWSGKTLANARREPEVFWSNGRGITIKF